MEIFTPIEVEIKTGRTQQELFRQFKKRGQIVGDTFTITSELLTFISRSYVKGEVKSTDSWTIVSFKIYPSTVFKSFTYLWLGIATIAWISFVIKALTTWTWNSGILYLIIFWIAGFLISQLTFKTSGETQEETIRQLIRDAD